MTIKRFRRLLLSGSAALCIAPAIHGVARADVDNNVAARDQLDEVIVTAQKRSESLNKVGLAVDVLSADALQERQITSLQDLTASIPSMTYADTPTGAPVISLRGVGFYDTTLSATPAVSQYVNQIPLAYPIMATHGIFDLQRVEVLKGPQGILFGENSTGGAINYIPAGPTNVPSAGLTVGYGSYNDVTTEGFVSSPISNTLSIRISERTERMDGWQQSVTRPDDTNGRREDYEGRILVDYTPTDRMKFELNLNGWVDRGQTQAAQLIGFTVQHLGDALPSVLSLPLAPHKDDAADWAPGLPRKNNNFFQGSLRGDIDLFNGITLTSLTAFSKMNDDESATFDGTPYLEEAYQPQVGHVSSVFQELRLANDAQEHLRWMVGANYQYDSIWQSDWYKWYASSSPGSLAAFGIPGDDVFMTSQHTTTKAAFTNEEFDLTDWLTLKGGVRYTDQDLSGDTCSIDVDGPNYPLGGLFRFLTTGSTAGYKPGDCYAVNNLGTTFAGVPNGQMGAFIDTITETNVSWRAGLDFKPDKDSLYYLNISKGYKTGGFPSTSASAWNQLTPLKQESVLDYEIGAKLSFLNNRLHLDASAFDYDYINKQLRARYNDPVWGLLDAVQNIPKSTVRGVDLSVTAKPIPGLTVTTGGTYLDAVINDFTGISAAGVGALNGAGTLGATSFAGSAMPYAPKWNVNADAEYRFAINDTLTAFAGASLTYRSGTVSLVGGNENPPQAVPNTFPLYAINPYTLVDLRAGIETEQWRITAWGKNVFNTYYWNTAYAAFDTATRYTGMPATAGVTFSYKM